jgi:CDP-6-deoxy-D-xylo-4-hexulose-3-dehydrase
LRYLNEHKIGTRLLFGGNLTRQPYMIGRNFRKVGDLAVSDQVMHDTFWVGVYPGITPVMVDYMASTFKQFFK